MTMRAPLSDLPIRFDEVSFAVRAVTMLERISLEFAAGAPMVLIGPNGAGKTTLIRLAMGLMRPTGGRVTWGGRTEAPSTRRAIVFQRPVMLRRSAAGNVRYALHAAGLERAKRGARVEELLALVGLAGLGGRPARKLSGGEQQRLAPAPAAPQEPGGPFLAEPHARHHPAPTTAGGETVPPGPAP